MTLAQYCTNFGVMPSYVRALLLIQSRSLILLETADHLTPPGLPGRISYTGYHTIFGMGYSE